MAEITDNYERHKRIGPTRLGVFLHKVLTCFHITKVRSHDDSALRHTLFEGARSPLEDEGRDQHLALVSKGKRNLKVCITRTVSFY